MRQPLKSHNGTDKVASFVFIFNPYQEYTMADTASASTPATPPAEARPVQPASGTKAPPEASTPNQTPSAPNPGQQNRNSEEERIRRLQSTYTQKQRQLEQQLYQRDQTLAQLQAQLTALQTRDMDDTEAQNYR